MDKFWKAIRTLALLSSLVSVAFMAMNRQLFSALTNLALNPSVAGTTAANSPESAAPGSAPQAVTPGGLDPSKLAELISAAGPKNVKAQMAAGALLLRQNKTEEALAAFRRAVEADPASVDARFQIGMILMKNEKLAEAGTQFREAIRLDPSHINSRFGLAAVLQQTATLDEAADQYKEILRLSPDNAEAYNNLGIIYDAQGSRDKAVEYFKRSLKVNPNDETVKQNLAQTEADMKMFLPAEPSPTEETAPAAVVAPAAANEPAPAPAPEKSGANTLRLANGRTVQGRVVEKTASGVWLEVGNGKIFFSNSEISEIS